MTLPVSLASRLHPKTLALWDQVELVVKQEIKAGKLSKSEAVARQEELVDVLLHENYPVNALGDKTLTQSATLILNQASVALDYPANPSVAKWLDKVGAEVRNPRSESFVQLPSGNDKNYKRDYMLYNLDIFVRTVFAYKKILKDAPKHLAGIKNTQEVLASTDLPYIQERQKCALDCFKTAKQELKEGYKRDDDAEMATSFIVNACAHYNLGMALLEGTPALINTASRMDTSCREALTEKVWDFVQGDELESLLYEKALKSRKQNKALRRALKDTLGEKSAPLASSRKM